MYFAAERSTSIVNQDFSWLVQNGMTREDLERNIERRPSLWARFAGFLPKLPSRHCVHDCDHLPRSKAL